MTVPVTVLVMETALLELATVFWASEDQTAAEVTLSLALTLALVLALSLSLSLSLALYCFSFLFLDSSSHSFAVTCKLSACIFVCLCDVLLNICSTHIH